MKTSKLNLTGLLVLLALFAFNRCTKEDITHDAENPIKELNSVFDDSLRMDITAPIDNNVYTDEELAKIEAQRLFNEHDIFAGKGVTALADGIAAFDKSIIVTKNFGGTIIFDNDYAKVQIVSGGISFGPSFHFDAKISNGALQSAQAYIKNSFSGNATYKVTLKKAYQNNYTKNLASWNQTAFTAIAGVVPLWVTFKMQIDANVAIKAVASCWVQQGVTVSSSIKVGTSWTRTNGWTNISNPSLPTFSATNPTFNCNANLTVEPGLKVYLSANLYSVLGPQLCVNPYFRFYLNAGSGGYYIDRTAYLRGSVYFSLSGLGYSTNLYNRDVFSISKTFQRYYYR
jgi:hypothetical protein